MSKLVYMLTIMLASMSLPAFAEEVHVPLAEECEEGKIFDQELGICVDAPEEEIEEIEE
jgi:hypothetical protein